MCFCSSLCIFLCSHGIMFWLLNCIQCQMQALQRQQPSLIGQLPLPSTISNRKRCLVETPLTYLPTLNYYPPPPHFYPPSLPYFSLYHSTPVWERTNSLFLYLSRFLGGPAETLQIKLTLIRENKQILLTLICNVHTHRRNQ